MKNVRLFFAALFALSFGLQACDNGKTYAEMKEEEADAINAWISSHGYKVISERDFYNQDTITHENEYVLFEESGVYMNIVNKGPKDETGKEKGGILGKGNYQVLSRFAEVAIQTRDEMFNAGDTLLANMNLYGLPDRQLFPEEYKLTVGKDSYSASFQNSRQYGMYATYGTTSVPSGWLVPFKYIKPLRTQSSEQVARVRLIVPHGQGTAQASKYVYPCYYEITYNLDK